MSPPIEVAREALERHWDKNLPVNPSAIAYDMDVRIVYDPDLKISGYLALNENRPVIHINPRDTAAKQRVAVFHELGHYLLGQKPHKGEVRKNAEDYDEAEEAADIFAIEMIMPREAVLALVDKGLDLQALAASFNVPTEAMRIRLEDLGLLDE